jgi:aldose 1-epimerase
MADEVLTVADGPIEVELLPAVGARLHRLRVFGQDLLRTPDDAAEHVRDPLRWGAYVMAPWCNRIAAVPTEVGGRTVSLPSNFVDGSAIHGQVFAARWEVAADGSLGVTAGGDGWPWPYRCWLRLSISGAVLRVDQSLTNLSEGPMPAGLGLHPWFRRPLELRIDADSVVRSNLEPDAAVTAASGGWDLRAMQAVPDDLDATWLAPGDPAVVLHWPELGVIGTMRMHSTAESCIAVASPVALDAVAIESETHAPQGLRRLLSGEPGAMHLIEPGQVLGLTTEIAFDRRAPRGSSA